MRKNWRAVSFLLHIGHLCVALMAVSMHSRQKTCPHLVDTGSRFDTLSMQMGHLYNSSFWDSSMSRLTRFGGDATSRSTTGSFSADRRGRMVRESLEWRFTVRLLGPSGVHRSMKASGSRFRADRTGGARSKWDRSITSTGLATEKVRNGIRFIASSIRESYLVFTKF